MKMLQFHQSGEAGTTVCGGKGRRLVNRTHPRFRHVQACFLCHSEFAVGADQNPHETVPVPVECQCFRNTSRHRGDNIQSESSYSKTHHSLVKMRLSEWCQVLNFLVYLFMKLCFSLMYEWINQDMLNAKFTGNQQAFQTEENPLHFFVLCGQNQARKGNSVSVFYFMFAFICYF